MFSGLAPTFRATRAKSFLIAFNSFNSSFLSGVPHHPEETHSENLLVNLFVVSFKASNQPVVSKRAKNRANIGFGLLKRCRYVLGGLSPVAQAVDLEFDGVIG